MAAFFLSFDGIVAGVVLLSGLWGFARGLAREALGLISWVCASLVVFYGLAWALPLAQRYIESEILALAAAAVILFAVPLIMGAVLGSAVARRLRMGRLNLPDRLLGAIFGAGRGVALVGIAYLLGLYVMRPAADPSWLASAQTLPYIKQGALKVLGLLEARTGQPLQEVIALIPGPFPAGPR